ncbi:MAG: ComEC/Rec2 family competence protein [Bacteroidales bacterium]|nr:ComEC/Rec2 family competence protein [Bacteroidales bacterium]
MKDSGDIAGTGIPFTIGVAAGTILTAVQGHISISIPLTISGLLLVLATSVFMVADSSRPRRTIFAVIFFLAGSLCAFNATLGAGIPIPKGPVGKLAARECQKLKSLIDSVPYPSPTTSSLVKALLTGDRSSLGKDIIQIFRASGASHILALSGLHLGILYIVLARLTSPFGNSPRARVARYCLTLGATGFYTVMTGASPSIVRAMLFITIDQTAKLLGRTRHPVGTFLTALTIQLAIKPEVITSLGFQLSYLAMAGIVIIYPWLESLYPESEGLPRKIDPMRKIWTGAVLSISCQVFTAPLVWFRFHTFPRYFLITNLTALPLTSAVMVLSVATIALKSVGICPDLLIFLNDKAVSLLVGCLEIISSM